MAVRRISEFMGDHHKSDTATQEPEAPELEGFEPSMIVGKIPSGDGLWNALEGVTGCDTVRNGVLVLFSPETSGRLGIFDNRFITGGIVDENNETGVDALKQLLAVGSGMFTFRRCLADETAELGQCIALDINELLAARIAIDAKHPSDALSAVKIHEIDGSVQETVLSDTGTRTIDKALISNKDKHKKSDKNGEPQEGDLLLGKIDYLDWLDENEKKQPVEAPSLRKLLPALPQKENKLEAQTQAREDVSEYAKFLNDDGNKVIEDIERTLAKARADMANPRSTGTRWDGLDSIPTPKSTEGPTHIDATGQTRAGAPIRTKKEFASGLEELVTQSTKPVDPRAFITKKGDDTEHQQYFWFNHPRIFMAGICCVFMGLMALVAANLTAGEVNMCIKEGREHLRSKRWHSAALSFTDAINKDPKSAKAYFYRGIADVEAGDEKKADEDFQQARQLGMSAPMVKLAQAGVELRHEHWDKALELCNQIIISGPLTADVYRLRANCHAHMNDFPNTVIDCTEALKYSKNDEGLTADILADRGYAEIQMKQLDKGLADFDKAMKSRQNKTIYMLCGDAFRQIKHYGEALPYYDHVIQLNPRDYDAYVARGMAEAGLHRDQQALADFSRALSLNPAGVEAMIQRGSLHLTHGAYRLAVNDLEDAYTLNPMIDETKEKLTAAYKHMNRAVPKELLAAKPASDTKDSKDTMKLPSDPQQLIIIGYKYMSSGNLDEATTCLSEAVRKAPNNPMARRYLAHALSTSGSTASAIMQFQALAALEPLTVDDGLTYAKALDANAQSARAAQVLLSLLSGNDKNAELRAALANLYYRAGQAAQAQQICKEGLAVATTDGDRQLLQQLLDHPPQKVAAPNENMHGTLVDGG